MSLALELAPDAVGLTCRAAVETAEAIEALTGISCGIKWVNDLFLNGRKVCGILTEAVGGSVILGIGVNLTASELPEELTSIAGFLNRGDLRMPLAAELTRRMLTRREREDYMKAYRQRNLVPGKLIRCIQGQREFYARAIEIDGDGGLVVEGPEGREILRFGEVSIREKFGNDC